MAGPRPALEAFGSRAFDVLRKPFRPSEVASVAQRALVASQRRRGGDPRRAGMPPLGTAPAAPRPEAAGGRLPAAAQEQLRAALLPIVAAVNALAVGEPLDTAAARAEAMRIRDGALAVLALIEGAGSPPAVAGARQAAGARGVRAAR